MDEYHVTTAEFLANFEQLAERAVTEPVIINLFGCDDRLVLLAAKEYERLKQRDRRVYRAHDVPEEILRGIEAAEPPPESEAIDGEFAEDR